MDATAYQLATAEFARYASPYDDAATRQQYCLNGLVSEVGEIAALLKRRKRDGLAISRDSITAEIGDAAWYIARLAAEFELDLSEVLAYNLAKLQGRKERDTLHGSGDKR